MSPVTSLPDTESTPVQIPASGEGAVEPLLDGEELLHPPLGEGAPFLMSPLPPPHPDRSNAAVTGSKKQTATLTILALSITSSRHGTSFGWVDDATIALP